MKLHSYITIVFCSILLISCGEEAPSETEASAEHTSIKTPADKRQGDGTAAENVEITENNTSVSNDVKPSDTENQSSNIKGSQNFDPNADEAYDGKSKGVATRKNSDADVQKVTARKGGVPQMVFQKETYNFGTVEQGENVKIAFELTNTGTGDLLISNAKGSCGCTEPSFPFLPIKPNTKSTIDVTFKTAGREGTQRKSVTITSNAYPKIRKVYLEGRVVKKSELKKESKEEVKEEEQKKIRNR